jgi:hypothetical protein
VSWHLVHFHVLHQLFSKHLLRNYKPGKQIFAGKCLGIASLGFVYSITKFRIFSKQDVKTSKKNKNKTESATGEQKPVS